MDQPQAFAPCFEAKHLSTRSQAESLLRLWSVFRLRMNAQDPSQRTFEVVPKGSRPFFVLFVGCSAQVTTMVRVGVGCLMVPYVAWISYRLVAGDGVSGRYADLHVGLYWGAEGHRL